MLDYAHYVHHGDGSTTGYWAVATWSAGAVSAGALRRPLTAPTLGNERVYACLIGGTSVTESAFSSNLTRGVVFTDGDGIKWQEATGLAGLNGDTGNTPTWQQVHDASTTITLGQLCQRVNGASLWICSSAGTCGSSEPAWANNTAGTTQVDNGVTWTCLGAPGGFSVWASPHSRVANAVASGWGANTHSFFAADTSIETQTTSLTVLSPAGFATASAYNAFYSVDHTATPPFTATKAGATVASTFTGGPLTINGIGYWEGFTFKSSGNNTNIGLNTGSSIRLRNCTIDVAGASAQGLAFGANTAGSKIDCDGCTIIVGNTNTMKAGGFADLRNCTLSTRSPNTLAANIVTESGGAQPGSITFDGCDLSVHTGAGKYLANCGSLSQSIVKFKDCKLGFAIDETRLTNNSGGFTTDRLSELYVSRCDSSGTNWTEACAKYDGVSIADAVVVRTGGASEGTTLWSQRCTTSANCRWMFPFRPPETAKRNLVTGSTTTVTMYFLADPRYWSALPTNKELWFDVEYLGDASSPKGSWYRGSTESDLPTANVTLTADTSAWDSAATARVVSTVMAVGNVIKVTNNTSRVFVVTAITSDAKTSANATESNYAGVVDGGTVTDGNATLKAAWRCSMTVTLGGTDNAGASTSNPAQLGYMFVHPRCAKTSSRFWYDPRPA